MLAGCPRRRTFEREVHGHEEEPDEGLDGGVGRVGGIILASHVQRERREQAVADRARDGLDYLSVARLERVSSRPNLLLAGLTCY